MNNQNVTIGGNEMLLRPRTPADDNFIISNWLHTVRDSSEFWHVRSKAFFFYEHARVSHLLERATTAILCLPDKPHIYFGFVCYEALKQGPVVHYVYVKKRFRRQGVMTAMAEALCRAEYGHKGFLELPVVYTYTNKVGHAIRKHYEKTDDVDWDFNSYFKQLLLKEALDSSPALGPQ